MRRGRDTTEPGAACPFERELFRAADRLIARLPRMFGSQQLFAPARADATALRNEASAAANAFLCAGERGESAVVAHFLKFGRPLGGSIEGSASHRCAIGGHLSAAIHEWRLRSPKGVSSEIAA